MGCTSSNANEAVNQKPHSLEISKTESDDLSHSNQWEASAENAHTHNALESIEERSRSSETDKSPFSLQNIADSNQTQNGNNSHDPSSPSTTNPISDINSSSSMGQHPPPNKPAISLPPLKKGYILKEGHFIKNWKNRFFVLDAGMLTYYESSTDVYPYGVHKRGEMLLRNTTLKVEKNSIHVKCDSNFSSGREGLSSLVLEIRYPTERDEWCQAIRAHIVYINASDV